MGPFSPCCDLISQLGKSSKHVREQRIEEEVGASAITGCVAASEFRVEELTSVRGKRLAVRRSHPSCAIEYRIHNTARIDRCFGRCRWHPAAVIVELAVETVEPTELDGVVRPSWGRRDHSSFVSGHELRQLLRGFIQRVEHRIVLQPALTAQLQMAAASPMPATAPTSIRHRCSCGTTTQPWRHSCAGAWKLAIGAAQSSGSATESPSRANSWPTRLSGC